MSPPMFILCIPGVALFFLIQMLICQAYHLQLTVARHKHNVSSPDKGKGVPKKDRATQSKKEQAQEGREGIRDAMKTKQDRHAEPASESQDTSDTELSGRTSETSDDAYFVDSAYLDEKEDRIKGRRKSVFAESYDPANDKDEIKVVHPKTAEEKQWLIDDLRRITLFQHLADDQITTVVDAMYKYPVTKDDWIMRQGDKGSTFYVVQTGIYDVFVKDPDGIEKLVHTYNNKGSFGELALLYHQPRAATIIARSDGVLWTVDGQMFRRIVHKITYQKRMMYENLINNVPILKSLEPFERANLVDALVPMTFQNDEEIVKQGAEGDGMYFIISGCVRIIVKTAQNKEVLLKELGNSDYFGELALVTDKPRAASAFSVGLTNVAFLDRVAFERLLGPCMDVIRRNIDDYNQKLSQISKEET